MTRHTFKTFFKYWGPAILWMGVVFFMATEAFSFQNTVSFVQSILHFIFPGLSPEEMNLLHAVIRKAGHVIEYFILGIFLFRAFRDGSTMKWKWRWSIFALIGVVLWAVSDEFHQSFVPSRTASVIDVGIDTAGGILGQFVNGLWQHYKRNQVSL